MTQFVEPFLLERGLRPDSCQRARFDRSGLGRLTQRVVNHLHKPSEWIAIDDYDGSEGTVLFYAPSGDEHRIYVRALLAAALDEAPRLGFTSLLAHWRAGWRTAEPVLHELGFGEAAPGIWRRSLR